MAATWSSIMAEGATMSAPAATWETAVCASSGRVWSLSGASPTSTPQWPWLVYSHRHTSPMSMTSG